MEMILERYERHERQSYPERQLFPTDSEPQVCLAANREIYSKCTLTENHVILLQLYIAVNHVFCANNCQAKVSIL